MSGAQWVGFAGTVFVIAGYAASVAKRAAVILHFANMLGCLPIGWSAYVAHAWASLVLTLFFGAVGMYGVVQALDEMEVRISAAAGESTPENQT